MKYLKTVLMVPQNLPCNDVSVEKEVTCDPRNTFLLIYRETGDHPSSMPLVVVSTAWVWIRDPSGIEDMREWSQNEKLKEPSGVICEGAEVGTPGL